ncbi:MAG TPA: ABC transporter ATP-binding protein [Verrucomicrobiae bacterium]|nr:ABC transporter ATP-binding protein [Verrucomicrobiae bacterium]
MIVADRVSKLYGAHRALSEVSFEIGAGEVVGFLGLNGAGKTTVLKILCGVLWPSAGRVRVGGCDSLEQPREVRRLSGFLPDQPPLYAEMTVRAQLRHVGLLNGVERAHIGARVEEAIETCKLQEVASDQVGWLSHGYRKRVGIAQAILHRPELVILDEPTAGLDPEQIVGMRGLIRGLAGRHTVLISSHILSEIERTCDRLLVLHEGHIVAQGREDELRGAAAGRVEITFSGEPARALSAAGAVPGVTDASVTAREDGSAMLQACAASAAAEEALVRALVEAGLGVRRVAAGQGAGLEAVFLALTRGSGAAS